MGLSLTWCAVCEDNADNCARTGFYAEPHRPEQSSCERRTRAERLGRTRLPRPSVLKQGRARFSDG